ncbi:phosphate-starvation-inducible PsiE family protein [Kamptonema sp. UHCC 0994]|uniref:phosphate-starvation-inducible PsiE family protein n=1 Tax=Kamptonema sp. UHCC 0994 TaxID=3031329 RepID=UPI0023B94C9B|nr:phosphate-starvation-inducible PsiE family protein [Kamptonema sp. UHCC 0994]MDF0553714.1 phosphate-starvation-inducible PsiE family protein [Kamptonema sp. UHCC 0994]
MDFKKILQKIIYYTKDENFLHIIETLEAIVSKFLSLVMIVVIITSVFDLVIYLSRELLTQSEHILKDKIFVVFGLFLNVLIALEILENITAYLKKHVVHVELVIVTSLIAVARKIIILDLEKKTALDLIGLAIAIFALSISYLIIRQTTNRNE